MNYLLKVTNTYRVPNEDVALALREELENTPCGELTAFSYTQKQQKIDKDEYETYLVCKATLDFCKEKVCDRKVEASYEEID